MQLGAARIISIFAAACCLSCTPGPGGSDAVRRVVSLSPSITRQIVDLEIEDVLAGVTDYHPPLKNKVPVIGTITRPNTELIVTLGPDAVICSEEDGAVQSTSALSSAGIRVVKLGANRDFDGLCDNYIALGRVLGVEERASVKAASYRAERRRLLDRGQASAGDVGRPALRAVFIVSLQPLMTVSGLSFIGGVLKDAGCVNPYERAAMPYPLISPESLSREDPDIIISMVPGSVEFFTMMFRNVKTRAVDRGMIVEIDPDHVAYYTPADYLAAVSRIGTYVGAAMKKYARSTEPVR